MDRRRAAGALLALAACIAATAAAPTASNQTALDLYDAPSEGCYYNFQHYGEGDRIMTNEPCLNCTCHNRMLMCYLRVCPFTKPIGQDCTVEKRADQCCPIVTCPDVPVDLLTSTSTTSPAEYGATGVGKLDKYGCSLNGKYFPEGSKVPPAPNKPCEHCYCIRNMTTCVMQECTLHVDGCTPIYNKDVCCPVRYSCDHPEDEIPLLDDMTTTVRPTPGFLLTTTTLSPVTQVSQDCVHDDQIVPDGSLIKTDKACEHCYCMKGDIVCVVQECGTPMENEGKNCTSQSPREGQCCPDTYICEGDEVTTELSSEFTTLALVTEEMTTILPPRRVAVEGSGYRNEPDEPYTELPTSETEMEGSGYEEVTESIMGATKKQYEEDSKPTEDSFEYGTSTARTPTLEEIETTEPDKGLNTVPSGVGDEESSEHSITEKTTLTADLVTEPIIDNKDDQGSVGGIISKTTLMPDSDVITELVSTEMTFKKEDEVIDDTKSGLTEPAEPSTEMPYVVEKLTTVSEHGASENKTPLTTNSFDEYESTAIPKVTKKGIEAVEIVTTTESFIEAYTTSISKKPLEDDTINGLEPGVTSTPLVTTDRVDIIETTSIDNKENEVEEDIPRIPGEGDCLLNEITYRNNSDVPSTNKCHSTCKCVSSIIKCDPIICSSPPEYMDNCEPTYDSPDSCCPTYVCHSDTTIPLQPHSQMSGTEVPAIIPPLECKGNECETSKVDIDSGEKPVISDCGSEDCSVLAEKPIHPQQPQSEDCVGGECQAIPQHSCEGDSCGVIEPEIKPVHVAPLCDNENDCKVPQTPQVPSCEGSACPPKVDCSTEDCSMGINIVPGSESQKPEPCNGDNACQTPQDKTSEICEGELCRRNEITKPESKLPSECKDSSCNEGKPSVETSEKPLGTKQSDEENVIVPSSETAHEEGTVTKSQEPVDVTESLPEKQTEIPEMQTTSKVPSMDQGDDEKETPILSTPDMEYSDTKLPEITTKSSEPQTTPEFMIEKVTEIPTTLQDVSSTEKTEKDGSITERHEEQAYTTSPSDIHKESSVTLTNEVVTKTPEPLESITEDTELKKTELPATEPEEYTTKLPKQPDIFSKSPESPVTEPQDLPTESISEEKQRTQTPFIITDRETIDGVRTTESTIIPEEVSTEETKKEQVQTESPEQETTKHKDNDLDQQTETPTLGTSEGSMLTGTESVSVAMQESHETSTALPETHVKDKFTTVASVMITEQTDASVEKVTETVTILSESMPTEINEMMDKGPQIIENEPTTEDGQIQSSTESQKLIPDEEKTTAVVFDVNNAFTNAPSDIERDENSDIESPNTESTAELSYITEHVTIEPTTEKLEDMSSGLFTTPHEPSLDSSIDKKEEDTETKPLKTDNTDNLTTVTPESHITQDHENERGTVVPSVIKESEGTASVTPEASTEETTDQQTETPLSQVTKILDSNSYTTSTQSEDFGTQTSQELSPEQITKIPEEQEPAKTPVTEIAIEEADKDVIKSPIPTEPEGSVTESSLLVTTSADKITSIQGDVTKMSDQDKTQDIVTETHTAGTETPSAISKDEFVDTEKITPEPYIPVEKESTSTDLPIHEKTTTEATSTVTEAISDISSGASEPLNGVEEAQTDLPEHKYTTMDTKTVVNLTQEISTQVPDSLDTKINVTPFEHGQDNEKQTIDDSYPSTISSKQDDSQQTTESIKETLPDEILATKAPEIASSEVPQETPEVVYSQEHLTENYPLIAEATTKIPEEIEKDKETTEVEKIPEEYDTENPTVVENEQVTELPVQVSVEPQSHDTTISPDVTIYHEIITESIEPVTTENVQLSVTKAPESHVKGPETEVSITPEISTEEETETSTQLNKHEQTLQDTVTETPEELPIKESKPIEKTEDLSGEQETETSTHLDKDEQVPQEMVTKAPQELPEAKPTESTEEITSVQEIETSTQIDTLKHEPDVKVTETPQKSPVEEAKPTEKTPDVSNEEETETSTHLDKHEKIPQDMLTEKPQESPVDEAKPTEKTEEFTSEPETEQEPESIVTETPQKSPIEETKPTEKPYDPTKQQEVETSVQEQVPQDMVTEIPQELPIEEAKPTDKIDDVTKEQEMETSTPEKMPQDMVTGTPQQLPIEESKPTEKTEELTYKPQEESQEKETLGTFTPSKNINQDVTTPISQELTTKQISEVTPEVTPEITEKYEDLNTQSQEDINTEKPISKTTSTPLLSEQPLTEPQSGIDSEIKELTTTSPEKVPESEESLIPVNIGQENVTEPPLKPVTEDSQTSVTEQVTSEKESGETDDKLEQEKTTEAADLVTYKEDMDTTSEDIVTNLSEAVTVPQIITEEQQATTPEPTQKTDKQPSQDEILKGTLSPQDVVTKEPEAIYTTLMIEPETITKSPMFPEDESSKISTEQTLVPKYEDQETTPYEVELEEHTHKSVEEYSTVVLLEQETTTKLAEKDDDTQSVEMTTSRHEVPQDEPTTNVGIISSQDVTKVTLSEKLPELSTISLSSEELPSVTTQSIPESEKFSDDISPPTILKDQTTTQPETLQHEQTPEVQIPVQTEKASTTEKSLETDTSQETVTQEEEKMPVTSKTTTVKDELSTQSPEPFGTSSKPEERPTEVLPSTAAPEVPKPGLNEIQSTDDIVPDDESQFPSSGGTSGYGGPEPDYVEEDQAFGPGTCRYGGKVYVSAQQIPRDDPCDFCFCFRSDIICLQQSCPPPIHGCHEEPIQGFCCPRYECPVAMATTLNITTTTTTTTTTLPPHFFAHPYKGEAQRTGCQIKGHTYKVGEVVRASSGPCLHCTCGGDGQMKCDPKACTPEPMLRQMIAAAVSAKRRR